MKRKNEKGYFILHANCIPVKGASRSLISDLQRGRFFYIPNDLYDILTTIKQNRLEDIYNFYGESNHDILDEYINFLLEKDLGFIDDEPEGFIDLDMEWDFPAQVTNSIIDIEESNIGLVDYRKVFDELSRLNCFCIQVRCFGNIRPQILDEIVSLTIDSRIKELRFVLRFDNELKEYIVNHILEKHKRVTEIIFFGAGENKLDTHKGVRFIYMKAENLSALSCGQICSGTFSVNLNHHTESVNFNSCLNRKISLDSSGNIKNCPSQTETFGNISDLTFSTVIKNQHFQLLWKIRKDDIKVCKDCEHRYICTDCRIFIEDKADKFSKPSKCSYDPYAATWN